MADPNDLTEQIVSDAAEPASSAGDGESSTGRPLTELIEADKHLAGKAAVAGTNCNGGPVSGWSTLRGAIARPGAAHQ